MSFPLIVCLHLMPQRTVYIYNNNEYLSHLVVSFLVGQSHVLNTKVCYLMDFRVSLTRRPRVVTVTEKRDLALALIWMRLSAATRTTEQTWTRRRSRATSSCCAHYPPTPRSTRSALALVWPFLKMQSAIPFWFRERLLMFEHNR